MTNSQLTYTADASSLIHAWNRAYPPDNFPGVWERIDELFIEGRVLLSVEVVKELEKKDDGLANWCHDRDEAIIEIDDDQQAAMAEIMGKFPKLVDTSKGRSGADSFVIALARTHNVGLTVVTEEQGGNITKPKIPFVCDHYDISHTNLLGLIKNEGWVI